MKKIITFAIISGLLLSACEKKVDPIDTSNASVTLVNAGTGFVTGDVTVNPKDSLFFSFTITSDRDMKYVSIQKNPVNQTAFVVRDTLSLANKNSYTAVKRLRADSANGLFLYRIVAHNKDGVYIGHRDVIVTVTPDFNYYTNRVLYVPDTTAKTNKAYFSSTLGRSLSYTEGAANSASIDFGYYYDTAVARRHTIYALTSAQPQLSFYDISSWTKNATVLKKITASPAPSFAQIQSAATLRSGGASNLASGSSNNVTALAAGNLVWFRTVAGKYGCVLINFIESNSPAKTTFMSVDVKIEK